jgi:lysyl-tRNA synthetase class 1
MFMDSQFWADQLADRIIERAKREGVAANIKCQQTPSGGKHIGNLNDVARAYFPFRSVLAKGEKATFVHTTDDRDPLKDVPRKLPDLKGNWHLSKDLMDMKPFLGMPLCRIPDPFNCCPSWSVHFTQVWMDGVNALGMQPQLYSVNDLYGQGKFEPYIRMVFEKRDEVGRLVAKFQETKGESYIPFDAICTNCGQLANIDDFDLAKKTVHFICGGKSIKKKKSEGCGTEGWASWTEGKLQWRFEWPALWGIFHTTFEPFGKDHAEGSWPSGQVIARSVYGIEPPLPFIYEFFLVNGEKMSASVGNVYIVHDMLKIVEPEVFLYFYTKRPGKQRNLDLSHIYFLVDDFERAERVCFGKDEEKNKREKANIIRTYEAVMSPPPAHIPVRVPYQFASLIGQIAPGEEGVERAIELLKFTGHIKHADARDRASIAKRLELAANWARLFAPEDAKLTVSSELPAVEFTAQERKCLLALLGELQKDKNEGELQAAIYDIARANELEPKEFFRLLYKIFLNRESGPRLGPFIVAAGRDRIIRMLKQVE